MFPMGSDEAWKKENQKSYYLLHYKNIAQARGVYNMTEAGIKQCLLCDKRLREEE